MFNPFGAITATGAGAVQGYTEDAPKIYDMMGMQALGRAFQMQGPIDAMNAQRGMPQPPMPGQPSTPGQPAGGPPMPPGPMQASGGPMPPMAAGPSPGPPMGPGGGGMPGGGPPGGMMPGGGQMIGGGPGGPPMGGGGPQGGMPQFDLQTLVGRINQANPNLPPQALVAALTRAAPLLNIQGKQELALLRQQMQQQTLDLRRDALDLRASQGDRRLDQGDRGLDIRENLGDRREDRGDRSLDIRERQGDRGLDLRERNLGRLEKKDEAKKDEGTGLSPEALDMAAERYNKTGNLPSLGWGSQARAAKAAILNSAAAKAQDRGQSTDQIIKQQQKLKAEQLAIGRFMSGPQANTTRSLGVVVDHLKTMSDLTNALENGDTKLFNRVRQAWATQTGSELPTNVAAAAQIVGSEIIKALGVAGAGTAEERGTAAQMFSTAKSPEQLNGAIKVAQRLLGGQLTGLRRQFVSSTGLKGEEFDALLGEEAKTFLEGGGGAGGGGSSDDSFNDRFKGGSAPKVDLGGGWSAQRVK